MVIESFRAGNAGAVGERFRSQGRMLPDSVSYVNSWMTQDGSRCFQLMEAPDRATLQEWMDRWSDLVDFDVQEVVGSADYWCSRA